MNSFSNLELIYIFSVHCMRNIVYVYVGHHSKQSRLLSLCVSALPRLDESIVKARTAEFEECCICMDAEAVVILPCVHTYCESCIEKWYVILPICALCRSPTLLNVAFCYSIPLPIVGRRRQDQSSSDLHTTLLRLSKADIWKD